MSSHCYNCNCTACQCSQACTPVCSTPAVPSQPSMTNNNNGTYTFFDGVGNSVSLFNIVDFTTLNATQLAALCSVIATECLAGLISSQGTTFSAPLADATVPTRTLYVTDGSASGHAAETLVYKDSTGNYHNLEV